MARASISNSRRLTTILFGLGLLSSASLSSLATSAQPSLFQPVLTGFRCEGNNEVTSDGVVIIEADSLVKVTLFGEYFTTDTIVGFTTEFVHHVDVVDQMISKNENSTAPKTTTSKTSDNNTKTISHRASESGQSNASIRLVGSVFTEPETNDDLDQIEASEDDYPELRVQLPLLPPPSAAPQTPPKLTPRSTPPHPARKPITEAERKLRRKRRRLLDSRAYDCTDYDRVISYKLGEENIITPNVAVLTIKLPELGSSSTTGMYYYFCMKQPPIPSTLLPGAPHAPENHELAGENTTAISPLVRGSAAIKNANTTKHVWVHQGDEWWLMIKVEPPILSITNDCILICLLLFLSAVTSGLNLGLMSLDMNELAVISSCGDEQERSYARAIAPLRKRGNYLLCSLLLGNVMVNSTLTVILEEMTSGVVAVIGSTLAIVVLGEIVPQAFCARQGLAIGAKTIYLTYAFMIITFPLSFPISCLLDCILGAEKGHVYDRERLMEFIRITGNHTQLEADEVAIISGALKLKKIKVDQIMTKLEDVFMLPIECMLDRKTIRSIIEKGYSRIPVYEFDDRRQIVALILAKDLALLDPDDQMPLASMLMYCKHPLIYIEDSATLDVALNEFKTGKSHMAIVRQIYDDGETDKYYEAIGVVTLEDVIEEVLQTEINDETDTLSDNRRKRRRTDAQVAHLVDELILESPTKLK